MVLASGSVVLHLVPWPHRRPLPTRRQRPVGDFRDHAVARHYVPVGQYRHDSLAAALIEHAKHGGVESDAVVIGYEGIGPWLALLEILVPLTKPTLVCRTCHGLVAMRTDVALIPKGAQTVLIGTASVREGRLWDRLIVGGRRFYVRRDNRSTLVDMLQ